MPVPIRTEPISREQVPRRRRRRATQPAPAPPVVIGQPVEPERQRKRHLPQATPVSLKGYRQPRGPGHHIPDPTPFVPFSGNAQRLPDEAPSSTGNLRANAIQRMREVGEQAGQRRRAREMVDRMSDLGRAIRRGGQRGDVVGPGKRKREMEEEFNPRPRLGNRPTGPQRFSIGT